MLSSAVKKNKISIIAPNSSSNLFKYNSAKFDVEVLVKDIIRDILDYKQENLIYLQNKIALVFHLASTGNIKAITAIIRWYYYGLTTAKEHNMTFVNIDKDKAVKLMNENPEAVQPTMVDIYISEIIIPLLASPNIFTIDASTFLKIKKPLEQTDQGQTYLKIINNFINYPKASI